MKKSNHYMFLVLVLAGVYSSVLCMEHEKKRTSKTSEFIRNLAIGSATGIVEVTVDQPLISIKNGLQQGKKALGSAINTAEVADQCKVVSFKRAFDPRVLYRGFGTNIAGMAPTVAVTIATNAALANLFTKKDTKTLTGMAALAGGISALVSTPIELFILHQGNTGKSAFSTVKQLVAESGVGVMARGITPKVGREGIFSAGFLVAYPWVEGQVRAHVTDNTVAVIGLSTVIAGGCTAYVSHPLDTTSTVMQADPKKKLVTTTWQAAHFIYNKYDWKGFYKGVTPRTTRICLAIPLMHYVKEGLTRWANNQANNS
ncbi:MAG: MC/SLC25 family protein [bacterium]|nr:MC/SLC25 family protein [bacterium]